MTELPRPHERNVPVSADETADGRQSRAGEDQSSQATQIAGAVVGAAPGDTAASTAADAATLPPASLPFGLVGLQAGGSVQRVLQRRVAQVRAGHTAESDRAKPLYEFVSLLASWFHDADRAGRTPPAQRDLAELAFCLEHLAAVALATLDRIDMENPE